MRSTADTRLKNTTVGMLRESCCCEMGWWGYAKRKEFLIGVGGWTSKCSNAEKWDSCKKRPRKRRSHCKCPCDCA
eukprot:1409379-Pyramimonas_sp.AAC.1